MGDQHTQDELCAAFKQLAQYSKAWEVVNEWLKERCFFTSTTKVDGNPLETYANESLRELYLEMQEFVRIGIEKFRIYDEPQPTTTEEE